jgi:RNA polymerase sigma-70 factor (ECF subfamily)
LQPVTEDQLISGIKSGNESAFRELVETYQKQVFNTCNALIHNTHDADDLSQEVFIEVFRSVNRFRGDARLSTWIYRIAVNKALNHIRRQKRRKWLQPIEEFFDYTEKPRSIDYDGATASSDMENQQLAQQLHTAIDSLGENQRTAFLLSKYEELPHRQIAEVMQTTLPAVESLIHRARLNLQKKLIHYYKKNEL